MFEQSSREVRVGMEANGHYVSDLVCLFYGYALQGVRGSGRREVQPNNTLYSPARVFIGTFRSVLIAEEKAAMGMLP